MDKVLQEISEGMIRRYSNRYEKLGYNVRTLGWGDTQQQEFRFSQTLLFDKSKFYEGKSILDIGCGFGDYCHFLDKQKTPYKNYIGYDLNLDLIQEAKVQHQQNPNTHFEVKNILVNEPTSSVADIGVMLGVLNLNLKSQTDNYDYSKHIIKNAFKLVNEVLVVDFLSTNRTPDYPKEDFVFYHDPIKMLEFAFSLSPNVVLKHDYMPIPQKEFMLFIYK